MGRADRQRRAVERDRKIEAMRAGVALVIQIPPEPLKALHSAMALGAKLEQSVLVLQSDVRQQLHRAMVGAGLDPTRKYRISDAGVAELVE